METVVTEVNLSDRRPSEFSIWRVEEFQGEVTGEWPYGEHGLHDCSSFRELRSYLATLNETEGSDTVRFVAKDGPGEKSVKIFAE